MFNYEIKRFDKLESTNTLAHQMAEEGAAEGLVITADFQTGGRGKPGRTWTAPAGKNLLFSVLLRPPVTPAHAPIITQIACRSVAKVLNKHGIASAFKRPNDVMVNGKKICGVLTESATKDYKIESLVIGIGLNVNAEGREMVPEAISMKEAAGKSFDREEILKELLAELKNDVRELYAAGR